MFPESCEPFQQITEPEEGVVGTPILSQLVRSTGGDLRLETASEREAVCGSRARRLWCLH